LYASAAVYVAPQTGGESFGIVLVEAMATGTAVVASGLSPFRAVLGGGEYGDLFQPGDPVDLARAIKAVLEDPTGRAAMRERAKHAAQRYDWGHLVDDIEAVYAAVVRVPEPGSL
jgi:phosphatidylinositol alpha-mannosyltransferase